MEQSNDQSIKKNEIIVVDENFFIGEDFSCSCGNQADSDGFFACLEDGTVVEPNVGSDWVDLYRCERCGQIYRSMNG